MSDWISSLWPWLAGAPLAEFGAAAPLTEFGASAPLTEFGASAPLTEFGASAPWLLGGAVAAALLTAAAIGFALGLAASRANQRRARDGFAALAAEALRDNTEGFLALAGERFQRLEEGAESDWETRRKSVEETVAPLREALERYRSEALELERARAHAGGELGQQVASLASETTRLANALSGPSARGRWGELTLRRTAELAGLSEHCDFAEQVTVASGSRPDMVVRLPGGRDVVVDAKAPLDAYLRGLEADSEAERETGLRDHARHVRRHVDALAARDYLSQFEQTPTFVVLFLPDEGFLGAALSHDRALVEHALGKGVVLATPATLYALLGAVARGWREVRMAESTREVLREARELDDRLGRFVEHFAKVGRHLGKSVESFNQAVGSFESRVLPQTRRMRDLGGEGSQEVTAPERVGIAVRAPIRPLQETSAD